MNTEVKAGDLSSNDKRHVVECVAKYENAAFGGTKFLITEQLTDGTPIRFLHFNENGTIIGQGEAVVPRMGMKQIRVAYLNTFSHQICMFIERNLEFMPKGCYYFYSTICGTDKFEDVYSSLKTYEQFRTEACVVPPQIDQNKIVEHLPGDWNTRYPGYYDYVAAIILDEDGRVLTVSHKNRSMRSVPIGKVDPGETLGQALFREMQEDLGVIPVSYNEIGTIENEDERGDHKIRVKTHIFWILSYKGDKPKNMNPKKYESMRYMSLDRIAHERDIHGYKTADALNWYIDNPDPKINL